MKLAEANDASSGSVRYNYTLYKDIFLEHNVCNINNLIVV